MLVCAARGLCLIGYASFYEKVSVFKKELIRRQIRLATGVNVICDEKDVESEINKAIQNELKSSSGWGINFEGWSGYDFSSTAEDEEYKKEHNEYPLRIEYIKDWKMDKVLSRLTMSQIIKLSNELRSLE